MVAIRAVGRVHLVLGLVAVAFALCVANLHPELKQQDGECAATEADAVTMRTHGILLFLSAGAQAAAAAVAAFAPDAWGQLHVATAFAVFANGVSILTYFHLVSASAASAAVAFGRCPGQLLPHRAMFIAHVVLLTVPLFAFSVLCDIAIFFALI